MNLFEIALLFIRSENFSLDEILAQDSKWRGVWTANLNHNFPVHRVYEFVISKTFFILT